MSDNDDTSDGLRLERLLNQADIRFSTMDATRRLIQYTGRTRDWAFVANLAGGWLYVYTYVCEIPEAAGLRAELLSAAMEANRAMAMTKFSKSTSLILELEFRDELLDATILKNILGLVHANAEEHFPRMFRIVSGDAVLEALEKIKMPPEPSSVRPRTSETHPLRIDVVPVPGSDGLIGMTLFPGRRDSLSAGAPWERDLATDLSVIRAWQPTIVLSLVQEHEYALLGVPHFVKATSDFAKAEDITWLRVPIRDGDVPDADFECGWIGVGHKIRMALRAGKRVLIHCRAGLGRTGMLAARILAEFGVPPAEAIASVRAVRAKTIETPAQERHVRSIVPNDWDLEEGGEWEVVLENDGELPAEIGSRFLGSLLGGAIGDAMGSAFEFVPSSAIEAAIGGPVVRDYHEALPGSLMYPRAAGLPTDDTAMTLALLSSFAQHLPPLSIGELHRGLCDALAPEHSETGEMFWKGGPGRACIAMLRAAEHGSAPFARLDPNAGGNGAAMRAHVCGLFPDRNFVAQLAAVQARLSHPHPGAVAAAQTIALIAHEGFYTGKLTHELPPEITEPHMTRAWQDAHRGLRRGKRLPVHLRDVDMAGWKTVAAAHAIAQLYEDDVERAIGIAAGSGRDTDTIASMVGAMLGAVRSVSALPVRWIDGLANKETYEPWSEHMVLMARQAQGLEQSFVDLA